MATYGGMTDRRLIPTRELHGHGIKARTATSPLKKKKKKRTHASSHVRKKKATKR